MHNLVKDVFMFLACVIAAAILYFLFFGSNGVNVTSTTYSVDANWRGVLSLASDQVETSISKYYYDYCFTPTIKGNDGTDELLGFTSNMPSYSSEIEYTGFETTAKTSVSAKGYTTYSSSYAGYTNTKNNYD